MNPEIPIEKRVSDLEAVLEISKAMAAEKELDRLLDLIIEKTTQVMDAERTSLFLVDHQTRELRIRTAEGVAKDEIRVPFGTGICGRVAATRQLENIADPYHDPSFDSSWDKQTGFHTRNMLCVPLITHEDKVVGVVQVLNKREGPFTKYDESLLLALGSHAAIALDQAELIEHYVEKKKMAAALKVAHDIQARVLPRKSPGVPGFDICGRCWPCDETGGDYFDFIELEDGCLGIAMGDVTGHGVGPALLMMEGRSLLRALVRTRPGVREAMSRMNELLAQDVQEGMFITLVYATLDPRSKRLSFFSAGHEPALLYRSATGQLEQLVSATMPMGILPGLDCPEPVELSLDSGDVLLLYTDGSEEAANADGEMFGEQRLHATLIAGASGSAAEIVASVHDAVHEFCGDVPLEDDLTLVAIKVV